MHCCIERFTLLFVYSSIFFVVTSLFCSTQDYLYDSALELFDLQLYRLSGYYLHNLLNDYPDYTKGDRASYFLAKSYQEIGDARGAMKIFHHTLTTYPNSSYTPSNWKELGWLYYSQKEYSHALYAYNMVENTTLTLKDEYESRSAQGIILYMLGELDRSTEEFKSLLRDYYSEEEFQDEDMYRLANIYIQKGDIEKAKEILGVFLTRYPESDLIPYVKDKLILTYIACGEFKKVPTIISDGEIKNENLYNSIYKSLYISHYQLNDIDKAIYTLNEMIDYYGGEEFADNKSNDIKMRLILNLAYLYILNEEYLKARGSLVNIIENSHNDELLCKAYYYTGLIELKMSNYEDAFLNFNYVYNNYRGNELSEYALYNSIVVSYKNTDYETAIEYDKEFQITSEMDKLSLFSKYISGESYFKRYDYEHAIGVFNDIIVDDPGCSLTPLAVLRIADCYLNLRRYDDATEQYSIFIEKYPQHNFLSRALWYQAIAYERMGDFEKANELHKQIFLHHSGSEYGERSLLSYITSLLDNRRYRLLIKEVESYAGYYKNTDVYSDILWLKGLAQYNIKDFSGAKKTFEYIVNNLGESDEYQKALYYTYLVDYHRGIYPSPIKASKRFIEEHPEVELTSEVMLKISDFYIEENKYKEAKIYLKRVIERSKDDVTLKKATEMLAGIYETTGELEKLPDLYLSLMNEEDDKKKRLNYLLLLAESYRKTENYELAIDYYQQFMDQGSGHKDYDKAIYQMGKLYKEIGLHNNAVVILSKFKDGFYKSQYRYPALLILAYSHQHLGNLVKAIEIHKMVLDSDNPQLVVQSTYWIGESLYHLGKRKDAKTWLLKVISDFPERENWVKKSKELIWIIEKYE